MFIKKSPTYLFDYNILTGDFDSFDFSNPKICHGGGGKGGGSSSNNVTTSGYNPPGYIQSAYQQALGMANTASSAPLQQYSGQTVAPLNSTENSAFGTINNLQGAANPYINQASNLINQGTQPLWGGVQQFSPGAVGQYQSPYTSNVLNTTMAAEQNQDAQQQAALQGNAISSGAWGGDRAGVASAVLSGQQAIANNATNANIENTGYNNALGEFNTQQQAQLGANEANSYLNQQGAFGMANLGSEALNTGLTGANAQLSAGQLQQQQTQAGLNVPYEQFLQQQAYPFQTAQFYSNIAEGVGSGAGGTSYTSSPAASSASQIAGLGLGGLGILGSTGAFGGSGGSSGGSGWLSGMFRKGGRVQPKQYAGGGDVIPDADAAFLAMLPNVDVNFIPTSSGSGGGSHGNTIPKAPGSSNPPTVASQLSNPSNLSSITKMLGSFTGSPSAGSSTATTNAGNILSQSTNSGALSTPGTVTGVSGGVANTDTLSSMGLSNTSGDWGGFSSLGSAIGDKRGGVIRNQGAFGTRKHYAVGGEVLPDVVSGVGDIIGTFFGDPGAGDQFTGILSNADGGATKGAGLETQLFGSIEGKSHSQVEDQSTGTPGQGLNALFDFNTDNNPITANTSGSGATQQQQSGMGPMAGLTSQVGNGAGLASMFANRGGRIRHGFDDGGSVGGQGPMQSASAITNPNQQYYASGYQNMTPEQLQMVVQRLPAGSQQQQLATQVLQQKRMMPNVGTQAKGGFGAQTAQVPTQVTPQPMPQAMGQQQQPGMARGGRMGFDDGGDVPPDVDERSLDLQGEIDNNPDNTNAAALSQATKALPVTSQGLLPPPPPSTGGLGTQSTPAVAPSAMGTKPADVSAAPARREANPWLALATAGFGMAAGNSPHALQNVGAGALAGMENYGAQQKEADTVNEATDKLMQEAKQHKDSIAIEQQNADTQKQSRQDTADYQRGELAARQAALKQKELVKDAFGQPMGWADPTTGRIIPIQQSGAPTGLSNSGPTQVAAAPTTSAPPATAVDNTPPSTFALPADAEERLEKYPANARPTIVGVLQGRIPPDRSHLGSNVAAFVNAAADVDSTFDVANPTQRMKVAADFSPAGQTGKQLTALENTSRHAAATALAGIDLNNDSSSWNPLQTTINKAENTYQAGRGDPRLTDYNSFLGNYGHEAMKVISGKSNPGEAETAEFMKPMDSSNSSAQILGALSAKNEMALAVAHDKQEAYDTAMGPFGQKKQLVSPEATQAFQDIDTISQAAKAGTLDSPQAKAARTRLEVWAQPVRSTSSGGASATSSNPPSPSPTPSAADIGYLRNNPAAAAKFESRFGQGSAQQYLGQP